MRFHASFLATIAVSSIPATYADGTLSHLGHRFSHSIHKIRSEADTPPRPEFPGIIVGDISINPSSTGCSSPGVDVQVTYNDGEVIALEYSGLESHLATEGEPVSCRIEVELQQRLGWQFGVSEIAYIGSATLTDKTVATLTTSYAFTAKKDLLTLNEFRHVADPEDDETEVTIAENGSFQQDLMVVAPCESQVGLVVNSTSQVGLAPKAAADPSASAIIMRRSEPAKTASIDGKVTIVYKLQWISCRPRNVSQ